MNLDLVGFDTEGGIVRRLITEMGSRARQGCRASLHGRHRLPPAPRRWQRRDGLRAGLGLSSRVKTVRLYK